MANSILNSTMPAAAVAKSENERRCSRCRGKKRDDQFFTADGKPRETCDECRAKDVHKRKRRASRELKEREALAAAGKLDRKPPPTMSMGLITFAAHEPPPRPAKLPIARVNATTTSAASTGHRDKRARTSTSALTSDSPSASPQQSQSRRSGKQAPAIHHPPAPQFYPSADSGYSNPYLYQARPLSFHPPGPQEVKIKTEPGLEEGGDTGSRGREEDDEDDEDEEEEEEDDDDDDEDEDEDEEDDSESDAPRPPAVPQNYFSWGGMQMPQH